MRNVKVDITGHAGSGKSSLACELARLVKRAGGEVEVFDDGFVVEPFEYVDFNLKDVRVFIEVSEK